jgi:copper(I)-binding protein
VSRSNKFRLAGAIAILIPVLAGCEAGLNAPTLQFHPAAYGGYASPAAGTGVTVSNAFVLGPALNQQLPAGSNAGVFLSMFTTSASGDELTKITTGSASSVKIDGGRVSMAASTPVRLTGPAPRIVLTGLTAPLSAGSTITLTLDFANAGSLSITIPVEPQAYAYATYAQPPVAVPTPASISTAAADATTTPNPDATATAAADATATPDPTSTTHKHKHRAKASATPTPTATPSPAA